MDNKIFNLLGKYSYTRLEKFINCPMAYKLSYVDGKYVSANSLALSIGTLLHKVNEYICGSMIKHQKINYDLILDYIENAGLTNVRLEVDGTKSQDEIIKGTNLLKKEFFDIQNKLNEYEKLSKCIDYDISASEKLLERLNAQIAISENLKEEINEIENSLNEYKNNSRYDYDFTEEEKLIGKYSSLSNDVEKIEDEVYELKCSLDEYAEHTSKIINAKDDIEKLKGKLPSTFPYCGNKINLSNF